VEAVKGSVSAGEKKRRKEKGVEEDLGEKYENPVYEQGRNNFSDPKDICIYIYIYIYTYIYIYI
jgi:hypothetical protein